ncbi:hypothetical protein Pmani_030728 [Petrolisthes manimaculis]|uniref:Fanconi anemia group I protein n=1 Tax=Petrolisthes manimaculis TaxID=1843537 RepID=A0AAE1TSM1_9EUCA|nr:hypothetical protein Pmani_030728 [Petrolisthes manimaculis]
MSDKLGKRVLQLIKSEDWHELEQLLLNTEEDWVLEIVRQWVRRPGSSQPVGGLITALSCTNRESTDLRLQVYEAVLRHVRDGVCVSERCAGELMGVLMVRVDTFPTAALVSLIDHYLELIKQGVPLQGRWVDLFAKLVTSVSCKEEVTIGGKQMAGDDYRYQVLKTLCDLNWIAETTTCLLPIFSDMDLPKEEMEDVIFKVERVVKEVEYQSVPPIMYQLINLGRTKLPSRVLHLIIHYFTRQEYKLAKEKAKEKEKDSNDVNSMDMDSETIDDSRQRDLTEAKGTVVLHITHFAQYNPALVRDYIKFIRASTWLGEKLVTPFNLTLSLSLSSIDRYEEQILSALKSCLLRTFREEEHSSNSRWLRESWGTDCDVTTAFMTTVNNCIMGWDQVSQGLVQLAFSLLECGGGPKGESYASQRATHLAATVLPLIVKKQPHLISSVLSRISNFILSASSPHLYVEILGKLAKAVPLGLLEHFSIVRGPLEYLEYMAPGPATLLLQAYNPLFKMNMSLKDTIMLIMRKMIFSKRVESRQVAVCGFLQFLRNFRLLGTLPSSQASMNFSSSMSTSVSADIHTVFNSSTNEALCLELLGILRRCFSQQHEVKTTFYGGLFEVCQTNPKVAVSIVEMLHHHLTTLLDLRDDILNPVLLKKVIMVRGDNVVLVEPMGDLLSSLATCKTHYEKTRESGGDDDDDDDGDVEVLNDVCNMFDKLTERLSGCDLEDLGINPNGDFTSITNAGQKNILSCKVMVGVLESLIEHTFISEPQPSEEKMQTIIALFKSQKKITDLVKEKSVKPGKNGEGSKGKGKGSSKSGVTFKSHLSTHMAADILATSLNYSDVGSILKRCHEFQMYLLSAIEETVSSVKGLSRSEKEKTLPHLKTIAKVLLKECMENLGAENFRDEREVVRLRHSLHILNSLMMIFSKIYKDKLEAIMKEILEKTDNKTLDKLLYKFSKRCQKMLLRVVHNDENGPLLKDASVIVNLMTTATQAMTPGCSEMEDIQDWIHQLCKDQDPDSSDLTKALMTLLIKLSNQIKFNHSLTRGVAKELHHKLGDFEQGVEVEESNKYKIITENTASAILTCILSHLDETLGWIELVLNKMKACVSTATEFEVNEIEKCISVKCTHVMASAYEVIQSAQPDGATIDQTLRVVTKLYNILSLYVKYYLDLFKLKNNTQISDKLEKVVHNSAMMISKPVYPMITYIESTQRQIGKKKQSTLTARAIKESKLIPSLIYSIEQYEKHLITLSRKSKVNLMQAMKLSTARDFRIMPNALLDVLEQENQEEENNAEENENENESHVSDQDSEDDEDNRRERAPAKSQSRVTKKHVSQREDEDTDKQEESAGKSQPKAKTKKRKSREEDDNENNNNTQNTIPPSKKGKKTPRGKLGRKV